MIKYTEEVEKVFRTIRPPYEAFIVDLVEYPGHMGLRVYEPNIDMFNQAQKVELATYLYELRDAIRKAGVGCEIEGVRNAPPARQAISQARESLLRGREREVSGTTPGGLFLPSSVRD